MDFVSEMNKILQMELEQFKEFIQKKLEEDKNYLEKLFWLPNSSQMTVLNYLVEQYSEPKVGVDDTNKDLLAKIDFILHKAKDVNVGEPLHQAIIAGKISLALHLLGVDENNFTPNESEKTDVLSILSKVRKKIEESFNHVKRYFFDVDKRDGYGRTLLSLALDAKRKELLIAILARNPIVHATTLRSSAYVPFQPIHQAVVLDYAEGITLLASVGAQLTNPLGSMRDTPVILAARLGKINALAALLELPTQSLSLESENNHLFEDKQTGHTAVEELCERMSNENDKADALRGIAMLICRGAEPPRNEKMRTLLSSNRVAFLKAVSTYLADKPQLVDAFVERCHLRESALHNIVYADHSWGSSIRHLFGVPSEAALIVEELVTRKYSDPSFASENVSSLSTTATENLRSERNPLKLYAEFVRRYTQAYDSQMITNRWSTMRWMIAEGNCDWDTVLRYSKNHPTSRTRIVLNEMFNPIPRVHEDIESQQNSPRVVLK
ncbi:TPA: Dot/Icm T4SS effector AnkC/LegA12 [Legionella pneumophila]|nr:Dot/Icm T4SS effector AnkC/LegA12 [Legionella pneumophila]HAT1659891.1 Dot/Icm T4SS effector AnkC/LegA12 [Legionella pneumophila]HAT1883432.1 Dot/Icm T4SS effector AnkC/LegA12 [Legionella pneumophila]HAT2115516.1 Dot/Icm T4SS effector AnkC/LegA12 [Legionella pneumophila]HAT8720243.1 Dot/Icm T4SS effector AnkC/LegA12 [Legionella pneumophila]HAU1653582.1 Dot/Icm T4SS effector AnkC/LegA12 [Legionella pneumophila]